MNCNVEYKDGLEIRTWADGDMQWFKDGLLHREDGPSMEITIRGRHAKAWHLEGVPYSEEEWKKAVLKRKINSLL